MAFESDKSRENIRTIYITGGSGWLAQAIATDLSSSDDDLNVVLVSRKPTNNREFPNVSVMENEFFVATDLPPRSIIIHAAFCRKSHGAELFGSLEWSKKVFLHAVANNVEAIVNISTQAAYADGGMSNRETTPASPSYLYALAKMSSELLLEGIVEASGKVIPFTNLRLASLMGVNNKKMPTNVLSKFIYSALAGQSINVVGGKQKFAFLDVNDAVAAIEQLLKVPCSNWAKIYNVGPDDQTGIMEMAEIVNARVASKCDSEPVPILLEKQDIVLEAGMDSTLFKESVGWQPKRTFQSIVDSMIDLAVVGKDIDE